MKFEAIKRIGTRLLTGFGRFAPFNLAAIAVACLMVMAYHHPVYNTMAFNVSRGLYWGALIGVVCRLEGELHERAWLRIAAWPVTIFFAALGCKFWFDIVESSPRYWPWLMLYCGSFVALMSVAVAILYRLSDEKTLFSRLVVNTLGVGGSSFLFVGSIELCVLAFDKLVAGVGDKLYFDVFLFVILTVAPVGFASLLPDRNANGKDGTDRSAAFLFWLLLPSSLILLAILYIYLVRIVISGTMPSGELNWFGSIALATYVFFWLSLRDSTRTFFRRVVRWGWALLIPVQIAQIVGIVIRYNAYGLSSWRFAGMLTLAIGIFALVLAAFNRRPRVLFGLIALVGIVCTVSPFNIIDVPVRNQEGRLVAALVRNGLSPDGELKVSKPIPHKDAKIIFGSWNYLMRSVSVYYRSPVVKALNEKLGGESLFKRLEIDESLMPKDRSWMRGGNSSNWSSVVIRFPKRGRVPVGDYTHVKPSECSRIHRLEDGRYLLTIGERSSAGTEEFDVTAHVKRLFEEVKWDGIIKPTYTVLEVKTEYLIWELRPDLAFAMSATDLVFRGIAGQTPNSFYTSNGIILSK